FRAPGSASFGWPAEPPKLSRSLHGPPRPGRLETEAAHRSKFGILWVGVARQATRIAEPAEIRERPRPEPPNRDCRNLYTALRPRPPRSALSESAFRVPSA